jgi:hypothetical protein
VQERRRCVKAEKTAWMAYGSAPTSALAQGYFVQALALAQAGNDRLLRASILDEMSHQATSVGRYTEAATLGTAQARWGSNLAGFVCEQLAHASGSAQTFDQ